MTAESDAPTTAIDTNQPLKTLGKYQIERKLGQGGMGTVYLARNTDLKKLVALKVLPRDKAKNPILVRRFKAEAQAAGQLEHPNIVSVYDTGEADGFLYIAMEYVEGIDLFEQVKRRGVIPVKRSIEIIKQVASALQHAFEHNIVHRDIKPSNLLLRHDGVVKVTDLGLARSIDDTLETNITRAGTTVGTVDYMAPEQARSSKSADVRSDIYSLGCTWYQMLTGEPPYAEGSLTNKLQAHAVKPLPDPREKNDNIPEGLIAVLQRMTAKKPADRYQTPAELLEDLANSKLTKAAFSNEIFSDLSDYDVDALQSVEEELDENDDDDLKEDDRPKRRKARVADDEGRDETPTAKNRRKTRSRVEQDDEADEAPDISPRRKNRSTTPDLHPEDDTQPIKSRLKPPSKPRFDDDDEDDEPRSSPKRTTSESEDDEADEPSTSKRKRSSSVTEEDNAPRVRSVKSSSSAEGRENNAAKYAPKPLPPKREPVDSDENRIKFNLEPLKFIGIAAGVLGAIAGLGWLIVQWSGQVETANNPFVNTTVPAEETAVVKTPTNKQPENKEKESEAPVAVTVVDPAKQGTTAPDRTSTEYDITKQAFPDWATSVSADPADLPVFTAGPGVPSATHFSSLDEALVATERAGGIVRLIGNGPFVLSRVELSNAKKIVVTGATPQDQPLIIVRSGESGSSLGIAVNNGILELRGLHFALDRSTSNDLTLTKIISVTDGQLFVRKCSFTANGNEVSDAIAIEFTSKQDSQNVPVIEPHFLLDHVTIRGNGLTGLQIDRTMADVVVLDSLIVTGTAPAIRVAGKLLSGLADIVDSKPRRTIRVARSTLSGRRQVFELVAENTSKPPSTAILFQDSICSAEGSGNTAVIVSATHWPSVTSTTAGWLTNLNWSSKSSLYFGFERFLDLDKSSYKVTTLEQWQRVWHKNFEPAQFQPATWPESVIAEISSVQPHDFDTAKLPFREMKTSKGHLPGCITSQLIVPGIISQPRITALGLRPKLPTAVLKPANSPPTRKINLQKEDLGNILNKNDWQNDTVFEASGAGTHTMQPARIIGKSLRIIFTQAEGPPLKIQPKMHDAKTRTEIAGLFTIEKGTLELQSASLEAPQAPKGGAATPWLIYARNANVILRGCQLSGPTLQDLEQHQGLIVWATAATNASVVGIEPNFLSVNDSLLMTTGVGIRFQSATGRLFLRNSIVAVRGNGIDLQPNRTGTSLLPVVDLEHTTFSTSKAAIRVEASAGTDPITSPMRIFADSCAVVAPLEFKPGEASESTIIECSGPVLEQTQVEWWGTSNGFSKEVKSFLVQSGKEPVTNAAGWANTWGEPNDVRLLTGSKGVLLSKALPNKWTLLKPYSFLLDLHSPSASWAEGGRPIGADIRSLEESMVAKRVSNDKQPGNGPTTKTGSAPTIGGKKNVGF
jgi:eukaryotic-like serine/threonine-protein kinase